MAAPNQGGSFSFCYHRPHLIQRERDVVTAACIIEYVRCLICSIPGGTVARSRREHALVVDIEKFPTKFRFDRPGVAANSRFAEKRGKLAPNFILLLEQAVYFITGPNRL